MHYFTTDQIRSVCIAARQAFDAWEGQDAFYDCNAHLTRTKAFDAWRHLETAKVTGGEQSLRHCISERHYLPLLAHFADLTGEGGRALKLLLRHGEEARIRVFFRLQQCLAERGLVEAYAAQIAKCKYKRELGDLSEKQLWAIYFDCKKRPLAVKAKPAPRHVAESLGTLSVDQLERRLATAVKEERYEDAAKLRDVLAAHAEPAPF
jgi:hypothetical protein